MPLSTTASSAPLSPLVKMEERKRPLGGTDDVAPPSKRQAVNGGSKSSKDDSGEMKDEAWVEDYTKDAIYRQMLEYKRQVATLEARLEDLGKRCTHHDDHIRVLDAWWIQFLQEIQLLAEGTVPFEAGSEGQAFPTHTTFKDIQDLELHLVDKAASIKTMAESIFTRLASTRGEVAPNVANLEAQVNTLLANQKDFLVKVARFSSEKEGLSEQLNTATLRYMKAERKLDRLRSTQVQKLEQQALANSSARPASSEQENGVDSGDTNGDSGALQLALQEEKAITRTQKSQIEAALAETKALQEQLTSSMTKLSSLSDEDYAHTELFKISKARIEDLSKRSSHLEAENRTLQSRLGELNGQREAYRQKLESEAQTLTGELEDQLQQSDTNLARIRTTRDELLADVAGLKANKEQERTAMDAMKELVSATEERIKALELELARLQPREDVDMSPRPDIDGLGVDELRQRYKKLEQDFDSINKELPAVVSGMKKYQAVAGKKVADITALEERLTMAAAEKAKADQKYFSVRKFDDTRAEELKRLRTQNAKSSEIISQLKENEAQSRSLASNLEKQLADLRQTNVSIVSESKRQENNSSDTLRRCDALKAQIADLNGLTKTKDHAATSAREKAIALETENEKLKARLDHTSKDRDKWRAKSLSNSSEEEEMLRKLASCSVCRANFKNTVLKTCGHVFCKGCIDDRIANRMRKCPNCSRAFDKLDVMAVHL